MWLSFCLLHPGVQAPRSTLPFAHLRQQHVSHPVHRGGAPDEAPQPVLGDVHRRAPLAQAPCLAPCIPWAVAPCLHNHRISERGFSVVSIDDQLAYTPPLYIAVPYLGESAHQTDGVTETPTSLTSRGYTRRGDDCTYSDCGKHSGEV